MLKLEEIYILQNNRLTEKNIISAASSIIFITLNWPIILITLNYIKNFNLFLTGYNILLFNYQD